MKNLYQMDLFHLSETVRIVVTGIFGLLAFLGAFFLLLLFVDLITDQSPPDVFTLGAFLLGIPGTVIGWLGLRYIKLLEQLEIHTPVDKNALFSA